MAGPVDEFGLIARFFAPLSAGYAGAHGLTDDAAFIAPQDGKVLAVTTDTMVEGVHFLPHTPPALLARKLVRVNLSDLAAKAATPFAVTLNAALPSTVTDPWLTEFAQGLGQDLTQYGIALIGGDTVAIPGPLCLGLTAFGWADPVACPHRSGAKTGDDIWVSGTIGDGGAGLLAAQGQLSSAALRQRYDLPEPRLGLGIRLGGVVTAAMDVSDGLVQDLGHICRASQLGAELWIDRIPLSADFIASGMTALQAATCGDDYELLFTASPAAAPQLLAVAAASAVDISRVGRMMDGAGVICRDADGHDVTPTRTGWRHFQTTGQPQ